MQAPERKATERIGHGQRHAGIPAQTNMVERIESILADAPAEAWQAGRDWYGRFGTIARTLAERFGTDLETASAVLSVTSPRVSVATNVRLARDILATWQAGGDVHRLYGLSERIDAARRILDGDRGPIDLDADGTLTWSRKVRSFHRNILGDLRAVTVDTWAQRAAGAKDYDQVGGGGYVAVAEAYRAVADRWGLAPRDLQAIVWVAVRGGDQDAEWQTLQELAEAPAQAVTEAPVEEFATPV